MKRVLSIVLLTAVLFSLAGCAGENSPALGNFICISAESQGLSIEPSDIYDGEVVLELSENGLGSFRVADKSEAVSWKLQDTELSIGFGDESMVTTIENDTFSIDPFDSGVLLTFRKEGSEESVIIDDSDNSTELQEAWNKSFYGWWKIGDANGEWKAFEEAWYDSFAVIQLDENGSGEFIMWDEDSSYEKPICRIEVNAESSDVLNVDRGAFLESTVYDGNWRFDTVSGGYDDLIVCEIAYSDDTGAFNAVAYLRPWGTIWDDIEADAPELLPYNYEDWYLPLVEAGSYMPMEIEIK